jgi:hypothetical protein
VLILDRLASMDAGDDLVAWEQQAARFGVELRAPLRDLDLIEFALSVPAWAWVCGTESKALLRLALGDSLPAEVRSRSYATTHGAFLNGSGLWFADQIGRQDWQLVSRLGLEPADLDTVFSVAYRENLSLAGRLGVCEFIARRLAA